MRTIEKSPLTWQCKTDTFKVPVNVSLYLIKRFSVLRVCWSNRVTQIFDRKVGGEVACSMV